MSWRLVDTVFRSALPAWLKPYATACATFAKKDGAPVYPTRARLARMVGKSERSTQRALHALCERGVLILERGPRHHRAPRYRFRAHALPSAGEPTQLPLFPQATRPLIRRDFDQAGELCTAIHRFPQAGETPVTVRGDTGVSLTVSEPSITSTHLSRAREKANARKTGT